MEKRPKIGMKLTKVEKTADVICIAEIGFAILNLIRSYKSLPAKIPSHFGFDGLPDIWGDKNGIIVLPVVMLFFYVLFTYTGRMPHRLNYLCEIREDNAAFQYINARKLLGILKLEIISVFLYVSQFAILIAQEKKEGLGSGFSTIVLGVIFGTIGIYAIRMIKNR